MKQTGHEFTAIGKKVFWLVVVLMLGFANSVMAHHPESPAGMPEKKKMDHSMHKMEEKEPAAMDHSMHKMEEKEPAAKMDREEALAKSQDVVAVMNAWVREAVSGAKVNGGYMTLVNGSDSEVVLDRIDSSSFGSVEIHQMADVDGMMEMQRIDNLVIKVGGNAVLKPGGKHLMMMGPEKDLVSGDNVELVLHFASGSVQVINLPVKK